MPLMRLLLVHLIFIVSTSANMMGKLVTKILSSPLRGPIVAQARSTMVKTAESAGLDWNGKRDLMLDALTKADWQSGVRSVEMENPDVLTEDYFLQKFHAYDQGNMCIEAAIEQEIAGKAVGSRNFPLSGLDGENVLRGSYDREIAALGGLGGRTEGITVVDLGSGTGTSTRRLAKLFPKASKVIGIDLSPYMVFVGRYLNENRPNWWLEPIEEDERIQLQFGDVCDTHLVSGSVQFVSISLVLHELPKQATLRVLDEAFRILAPGGRLAIMEMDSEAPGYVKLRNNAMLFSVLQSTEPFLLDYFDLCPSLPRLVQEAGFAVVRTSAATGRHLSIVAIKAGLEELRPSEEARMSSDQHLNTMKKSVT